MTADYRILLVLFLVCLLIRNTYELLKNKGAAFAESKGVFILVLIAMLLLWLSWFAMCPRDPLGFTLPESLHWLGLTIFLAGTVLAVGALFQLRGVEHIDHLVTGGLFAKIRHPMYTGFILWIFGWAVFHGAGASLIGGLAAIWSILYWRQNEERGMEEQYGAQYREYRLHTWF